MMLKNQFTGLPFMGSRAGVAMMHTPVGASVPAAA